MKKTLFLIAMLTLFITFGCKKDKPEPPVLTTTAVTNIAATLATSGGNILTEGSSTVLRRGVCYSINNTPTIKDDTTFNGTGAGKFDSHIKGLNYNSDYYVRAYAINADAVGYGSVMSFKTPMAKLPVIFPDFAKLTNLTATSALTSTFFSTSDIGVPILSQGVCWRVLTEISSNYTYTSPTILDNKAEGVVGSNQDYGASLGFTATMTGLTENTLYVYNIYATNVIGTTYTDVDIFMTPPLLPTPVYTYKPIYSFNNNTGQYYYHGNATVANNGQVVFAHGACWSTSPHPIASDTQYSIIGAASSYTYVMTGVTHKVLYYVRAWVNYNTPTG